MSTTPQIGDTRPSDVPAVIIMRDHYRHDGKPKRSYDQSEASRIVAKKPFLRFYKCSQCGDLHVGKRPDPIQ